VERLATLDAGVAKPRRGEYHFMALVPLVDAQLDRLHASGIRTVTDVPSGEQVVLRHAFLFRTYHRHVANFDELIKTQLEQPHQSAEAMTELRAAGSSLPRRLTASLCSTNYGERTYFIARVLVGESASMRGLREALWNNVFTHDVRTYDKVLWSRMEYFSPPLLGETGTGKGSASAAIGRSGHIPFDLRRRRFVSRFTDAFIATNWSPFPEALIESELFGHRKGAVTGAVDDHDGLFARCREYGTLFVDEVGDVSESVQIKLLRVLQERVFTPVGSHRQQRFAGRVIAATNQSLDELRSGGRFRDDFFIVCTRTLLQCRRCVSA